MCFGSTRVRQESQATQLEWRGCIEDMSDPWESGGAAAGMGIGEGDGRVVTGKVWLSVHADARTQVHYHLHQLPRTILWLTLPVSTF